MLSVGLSFPFLAEARLPAGMSASNGNPYADVMKNRGASIPSAESLYEVRTCSSPSQSSHKGLLVVIQRYMGCRVFDSFASVLYWILFMSQFRSTRLCLTCFRVCRKEGELAVQASSCNRFFPWGQTASASTLPCVI